MLVANSFDLWQKDTFFSAAEEVQRSADIMESAYRTWQREKMAIEKPHFLDELSRELQMALGTAKWQLEEFERAVRMSYRSNADEVAMARHRQFVSAIEAQISRAEEALRESFDVNGKQPFRWVNLDAQDCDDLALFLSGTNGSSERINDGDNKYEASAGHSLRKGSTRKHVDPIVNFSRDRDNSNSSSSGNVSSDVNSSFVSSPELKASRTADVSRWPEKLFNSDRARSSLDLNMLEIVVDGRCTQEGTSTPDVESTPKEKGSKPYFWRLKHADSPQSKSGILSFSYLRRMQCINQLFGRVAGSQRPLQSHPMMSFTCSPRLVLVFTLAVFLVVPFLVYST